MPYTYKKTGNEYTVYKKDTGKKVGSTKGDKESLRKYLAALHLNTEQIGEIIAESDLRMLIRQELQSIKEVRPNDDIKDTINVLKELEQHYKDALKYISDLRNSTTIHKRDRTTAVPKIAKMTVDCYEMVGRMIDNISTK